jgi:hypothetical protein
VFVKCAWAAFIMIIVTLLIFMLGRTCVNNDRGIQMDLVNRAEKLREVGRRISVFREAHAGAFPDRIEANALSDEGSEVVYYGNRLRPPASPSDVVLLVRTVEGRMVVLYVGGDIEVLGIPEARKFLERQKLVQDKKP